VETTSPPPSRSVVASAGGLESAGEIHAAATSSSLNATTSVKIFCMASGDGRKSST